MKRLSRAVRQPKVGGKALPKVFRYLPAIRRSEVTLIGGQSNAGKSLLALWQSVKWTTDHELRGIYFSADAAELGQAARALAMSMFGVSVREAEELLEKRDPFALEAMEKLNDLLWSFEDDLSYANIDEEIRAAVELWGCAPDYIIIDNLTDVEGQSEDEWGSQRRALKALVQLARMTDSAVIVLAHTSESEKEDPCPPKKSFLGKVSQKPAQIWTTADMGEKRPVAVVKDRYAAGVDKTGQTVRWLRLDQSTLHFSEV